MKVRALRGVCVGVERHLKPGDAADLESALALYLVGIGAVELVNEPAAEPAVQPEPPKPAVPVKPGKKEK